jgi:predicted DCC family thiol-disulfide oxidoreductase YuxK
VPEGDCGRFVRSDVRQQTNSDGRAWVIWDGECGFCRRSVAWAVRHDAKGRLRPAPFQRVPSPPMAPQLQRACRRAVHVIKPDGTVLKAGRAALYVLGVVGWPSIVVQLLSLPPLVWLVEIGYRIVANNRMVLSRFLFRDEAPEPALVGDGPDGP